MVAVLGVAGLGLLVDRLFLGAGVTGPAESSAGVVAPPAPGPDAVQAADTQAPITPTPLLIKPADNGPTIAERISRLADNHDTHQHQAGKGRDAFTPAPGWSADSGSDTQQMRPETAVTFRSQYTLDAVMDTGLRKCAVVNGQTVYLGDTIDGYKLLSVHTRSAVFEIDGIRVELGLARSAPAS